MLKRNIVLMSAVLLSTAVTSMAQTEASRSGVRGEIRNRQARTSIQRPARAVSVTPRSSRAQRGGQSSRQPARRSSQSLGRRVARTVGAGLRIGLGVGAHHDNHHDSHGYRTERYWVPGCHRQVWVPAHYEYRYDPHCGRTIQVLVQAGHYHTVQDPGYWAHRRVRIHRHSQRHHVFSGHFR